MELSQELVKELLHYCETTGKLFWKSRGKHWFSYENDWSSFNTQFSGREVNPNYKQFKLLGTTQQKSRMVWLWNTGWLLNGQKFKVITMNRDPFDTRIENLCYVPMNVCMRQKMSKLSKTNSTFDRYGVCYSPSKDTYVAYVNSLGSSEKKRIVRSKYFNDPEEAWIWRLKHEPRKLYWNLEGQTTGDFFKNNLEFDQVVIPHSWNGPREISDKLRRVNSERQKSMLGVKSNVFKGATVGVHTITGETIKLFGERDMEERGFNASNIYRAINELTKGGKRRTHLGYLWHREDKEQ